MAGRLVAVVGPSGVGKDSVMAAICAADPGFKMVRRVITRPVDAGGEDFDTCSDAEFDARVARGDFAVHWQAHGLRYGVPIRITGALAKGQSLLVNLSRGVLLKAQEIFPDMVVLSLTAPVAVLAGRLAVRGRETPDDIRKRLERAAFPLPDGLSQVIPIDNGGTLAQSVSAALAALSTEAHA